MAHRSIIGSGNMGQAIAAVAGTLSAGTVGPLTTTVLIADDDADAKSTLAGVVA